MSVSVHWLEISRSVLYFSDVGGKSVSLSAYSCGDGIRVVGTPQRS